MNEQITSAAELDALLHDLNEAGHMPKILVVDRCNIAALAWCEEVGGDDLVTGVTMAGPREDEDLIGGRDRPTSSLYFPVRIVWRPDAPTPAPAAPAMPCRTFDDLGNPICDAPAEFIVWGHLYEKRHKGPKCRKHLPPQSGVLGFGVPAIYAIPTAPATVQPTVEQVARTQREHQDAGSDRCSCGYHAMDRDEHAARAVLALFAEQPTVAEVKAEALREAANDENSEWARKRTEDELIEFRDACIGLVNRRNGLVVYERDGEPSSIIRLGFEMAWKSALRDLADRIEREARP